MTPELCAACHHAKDDSTMHLDAPGENWGAALHWYEPPTPELEANARRSRPYREELLKSLQSKEEAIAYLNAAYEDSQVAFEKAFRNVLSAERKWWIERIEQERDKWDEADRLLGKRHEMPVARYLDELLAAAKLSRRW